MLRKLLYVLGAVLVAAVVVQIFLPTILGTLRLALNLLTLLGIAVGGYFIYKRLKR
jgi:hypothetical protein